MKPKISRELSDKLLEGTGLGLLKILSSEGILNIVDIVNKPNKLVRTNQAFNVKTKLDLIVMIRQFKDMFRYILIQHILHNSNGLITKAKELSLSTNINLDDYILLDFWYYAPESDSIPKIECLLVPKDTDLQITLPDVTSGYKNPEALTEKQEEALNKSMVSSLDGMLQAQECLLHIGINSPVYTSTFEILDSKIQQSKK